MIAIGILLLLAAVGTAAMVATGGDAPAQVTFGAFHVENTTAFFFFAGAMCAAVLVVGGWSVWCGFVRWRERGRELQRLRAQVAEADEASVPAEREHGDVDRAASLSTSGDALAEVETAPLTSARWVRGDVPPAEEYAGDTTDPFTDHPRRHPHRRTEEADDTPVVHRAGASDDAELRT